MFHHLNNPIYGVLIDSIINSYLISKAGYSISGSDFVGLVGNSYCDYFGSAHYPGMLDVGLRVVKMGKSSVMCVFTRFLLLVMRLKGERGICRLMDAICRTFGSSLTISKGTK